MMDMKEDIFLRDAEYSDMELIYEWANDEEVRKNSFQSHKITMEEHRAWYENKMKSESTLFYILMNKENPIGQIRLELEENFAQINYSIAKSFRGKGFGKAIIELSEKKLKQEYPHIRKMIAEVKAENASSQNVFERSGYKKVYIAYEKAIADEKMFN